MFKKISISLAALAAGLIALASPITSSQADTMPAPGQIQPLSNGDGGGP
jgi:hypothetical protein